MRKLICVALLLIFVFLATGCSVGSTSQNPASTPDFISVRDEEMNDRTIWLYHSGSDIDFISDGETIEITLMQGDLLYQDDPRVFPRVGFYVNGERIMHEIIDQPQKIVTLHEEAEAVIKIIKLSEGTMSNVGIKTEAKIASPQKKELLIEFIGDSITTGYGVDGNQFDSFTTATQDVTKTYAYKTAQVLNADFCIQAVSGSGVVSGSTTGAKMPEHVMPLYYKTIYPSPDIIVINLGTNDSSYTRRDPQKEAEFTDAYAEFLHRLRNLHSNAHILCTLGIMGDNLFNAMEKAVEIVDDKNTALLRFENQQASDGYGSDWHPSEETHEKAGKLLTETLMVNIGASIWK